MSSTVQAACCMPKPNTALRTLHPGLQDNVGNIALLQRAESVGLLPAGVGEAAAQSYRQLRHVQHMARLDEATTQLPDTELQNERQAMTALWEFVFLFS